MREPEVIDQLFASLKGRSVRAAYEDIEQPASSDRALLLALDDGSWLRFFPCSQSLLCGVLLLSAEGHLREGPKGMVPLTPHDPKAISWHRALLRAIERRALVRELRNGDLGLELHFDANEVLHLQDQVSAPACYESWFSWTGAPIHLPDPADVVRRGAPRTRDRSRVR